VIHRRRLLAVGFATPATGLNRVMTRLLAELVDAFEVHWLGLGYRGPIRQGPVKLHPSNIGGGDVFGAQGAADLLNELHPDVVLLYNDPWLIWKYRDLREHPPSRIVAYCPLDGRIVDGSLIDALAWVDDLVVFTDFARSEIARRALYDEVALPDLHVVGHGIDDRRFTPVPKTQAREVALPVGWHDAFVVLNANRLQARKRVDLTVDGFAQFAAARPRARLFLQHAYALPEEETALRERIEASGVADRIHMSRAALSDEELNLLYNACDVGLNTAAGEGWGLVSFEHALTGAAQIVPRHSACAELWHAAAEFIEPEPGQILRMGPVELECVTSNGVAAALARLHDNPGRLAELSDAGRRNASRTDRTWAAVGCRWRAILDRPQTRT
jgi:D-inositol-3-phosphate glycosyltransferase